MVIRINNIGKWTELAVDKVLDLAGEGQRKVRVELNCEAPTRLDVWQGVDKTLLAVVEGYQVVEFSIDGEAELAATSEGEVWYFTNHGDDLSVERPDEKSITTIMSRRARNPQQELMMFKLQQNVNKRMDALAAEADELRAALAAATPHDAETGEVLNGDGDAANIAAAAAAAAAAASAAEPPAKGEGTGNGAAT